FMPKGGRRPWLACLVFEIKDESLDVGDQVYITMGDRSGGSKGHQVQTYVESDFCWLTDVEAFETGTWVELSSSPVTPILGADPHRVVGFLPYIRKINEPFQVHVKCEDQYGNTTAYKGNITLQLKEITENGEIS